MLSPRAVNDHPVRSAWNMQPAASAGIAGDGRHDGSMRDPVSNVGSADASMRSPAVGESKSHTANVLIIDDCALHREVLVTVLGEVGFPAPSIAWDLSSLIMAIEDNEPDVTLLSMSAHGSLLLLRAAMDLRPSLRVIALGVSVDDEAEILASAEAGVAGYHMRSDSLDDLLALISEVAAGQSSCPPVVSAMVLRHMRSAAAEPTRSFSSVALTTREAQVLSMLEQGLSNQEIAAILRIALHTVKNHVHNVLTKLDVSTRAEAAAIVRGAAIGRGASPRTRPRSTKS